MNLSSLITKIHSILNSVVPVILVLGVVYFVWGVVQYVIADSEEAKNTGKDRIIYGVVGLAVVTSLFGIVNLIVKTFDIGGAAAPTVSSLGSCVMGKDFAGLANYVACNINNAVIPFLFALALAAFVWGVVKFFIINPGDETKRTEGKQFMMWGLVAITIMLSIWGLVNILGNTFGINTMTIPQTVE